MCPMCTATITAWLLAGSTGGAVALTTALLYRKCQTKKLNCKAGEAETVLGSRKSKNTTGR